MNRMMIALALVLALPVCTSTMNRAFAQDGEEEFETGSGPTISTETTDTDFSGSGGDFGDDSTAALTTEESTGTFERATSTDTALADTAAGDDDRPANLPAELGGGMIVRPGDLLAQAPTGNGDPVVDVTRRVLPLVPGGNPSSPLDPTGIGVATPSQILDRTMTPAANSINNALTGGGTPGAESSMGSQRMPTGWFSSTPNVTLGVNGQNVTLPMPPVSGGTNVTYYRVPVGGGYQVEARGSDGSRYQLQNGTNSILPFLGSGYGWVKR